MSSSESSSRNKVLVAAAVGAGVIIGAAGLFLINQLTGEKKKLKILEQELARLELSLSKLQDEFCLLRNSELEKKRNLRGSDAVRSLRNSFSSSVTEYGTPREMLSALNSDDEEFFEVRLESDEERSAETSPKLFREVDILMKGDDEDRQRAFDLLKENEYRLSENPDFLWRYAKAHQMKAAACDAQKEAQTRKKFVIEGLEHASKALALDRNNSDVNKWFAILTGMQTDYLPVKEKIQNAHLFYKHVLIAIESKPTDYSLFYLLGRFKFEVAGTSWAMKKLASSLFSEILPDFTYSDARKDLLTAERLNPTPWKENQLLLAKCCFEEGSFHEGVRYLESAKDITPKTSEDRACDLEIDILHHKYKSYAN